MLLGSLCYYLHSYFWFLCSEIQLKSPNWLFGHRKYEESGTGPNAPQQENENGGSNKDVKTDGCDDFDWLSSVGDMNDEDVFLRYLLDNILPFVLAYLLR